MQSRNRSSFVWFLLILAVVLSACTTLAAEPLATDTPKLTATLARTATVTPRPSFTIRPTDTPNLTATQLHMDAKTATQAYFDNWKSETQKYYDLGYLTTTDGAYKRYGDFVMEWAQLNWYQSKIYEDDEVKNFYMSAHFKWSSAYRNADLSGCGFIFALQDNYDKYSVFLDRNRVLFYIYEESYGYARQVGLTSGTDRVKFGNPFDQPVEADFTLIVSDAYARVLVDGELVSEYALSKNKLVKGGLGAAILSGTNKDFGTRCEMTDFHAWISE